MIPRIIHFIFGLAEDFGGKPFSFLHYMAVRSAVACNPGYRVKYYYKYQPTGIFWEAAKRYLELVPVEPPAEIFGRPLCHVAHQSDVIRLQRLLEEGGIYLDLDTITVRSFDALLDHEMVMGVQGRGQRIDGLCNAVMLAAPGSRFVRRWLDSYTSFRSKGRDQYWDEHSVQLPLKLARQHPDEITILDRGAFFYPSAEPAGIIDLFVENKRYPVAYCHHLWEGLAWNLVKDLDERRIFKVDTTYNVLARRFIDEDLPTYKALRAAQLDKLLASPIRLNLGSGANPRAGWLNVDVASVVTPDLEFDITQRGWPLPNDSVGEVEISHVLEHTGSGFEVVVQELYRVCADGATVRIKLPHPRHDWFLGDPTHNRPLLPRSFELLDLEKGRRALVSGDTKTPLAIYLGVDFEVVSARQILDADFRHLNRFRILLSLGYPFLKEWGRSLLSFLRGRKETVPAEERRIAFLSRHLANVVGELQVTLRVRKGRSSKAAVAAPGSGYLRIDGKTFVPK